MCHGFEMHKGTGPWQIVHGDFNLKDTLTPEKEKEEQRRRDSIRSLGTSAAVMGMVMVLELSAGYWLGSLAILSDGSHQASDVILYLCLMIAVKLSGRQGKMESYSFGYDRAQVLGALGALLFQYFATGLLVMAALRRLTVALHHIDGLKVAVVGGCSLIANSLMLRCLPDGGAGGAGGHGHSHGASGGHGDTAVNVARLHMLGDLVQGCTVILTGATVVVFPSVTWVDPVSTFIYALVVLGSSWRVFQELVTTLMERAPLELDVQGMFDELGRLKGVIDVHCCHCWVLAPGKVAMSAHLHIEEDKHEEVLHSAQILVKHRYGIVHSTLQVSEDEDLA